jgi:hypothetical protein
MNKQEGGVEGRKEGRNEGWKEERKEGRKEGRRKEGKEGKARPKNLRHFYHIPNQKTNIHETFYLPAACLLLPYSFLVTCFLASSL